MYFSCEKRQLPKSAAFTGNFRLLYYGISIQWVESPWHDRDVNPHTGELKKKHKHVCVCFDSVKTYEQVKEITDMLHSPIPQRTQERKPIVYVLGCCIVHQVLELRDTVILDVG